MGAGGREKTYSMAQICNFSPAAYELIYNSSLDLFFVVVNVDCTCEPGMTR